jgi:threonine dehydrogenase-like Zn-dependent dehydrogenase
MFTPEPVPFYGGFESTYQPAHDVEVAYDGGESDRVLGHMQQVGLRPAVDLVHHTSRATALGGTRSWGRLTLVGEGGRLEADASPAKSHHQLTVYGSWVTSIGRMEELVGRLVRWNLHPERTVTDRFPLAHAAAAYGTADEAAGARSPW